jgi:hypothetical protein
MSNVGDLIDALYLLDYRYEKLEEGRAAEQSLDNDLDIQCV